MSCSRTQIIASVSIQRYFDEIVVPQMSGYFNGDLPEFSFKPTTLCPLHNESTPSFRYYEETASFYCWGCGNGGDIVRLHMLFTKSMSNIDISVQEAIDFLERFFIRGDTTAESISVKKDENRKSTNCEDIIAQKELNEVEDLMLVDENIDLGIKEKVWNMVDDVSKLIAKDICNSMECSSYLEQFVKGLAK